MSTINQLSIAYELSDFSYTHSKLWGLDLSWSCLDQDFWSLNCQKVCLDSWGNLDIVKKFISTVEKSQLRLRLLDFVLTSMSRHKSLDQDWEVHQDEEILSFLNSLFWSWLRSKWIFAYFLLRFLKTLRLFVIFRLKKPWFIQDFLTNLDNLNFSG